MAHRKTINHLIAANKIPAEELGTLLKVSGALASSLDLPVVLQTAIESTVEVLRLETGAIYQLDGEWLYLGATTPKLDPHLQSLLTRPEAPAAHPHLEQSLRERRPVVISDAQREALSPAEAAIRDMRHLRSILFIPLILEGKASGVMIVGTSSEVRDFSEHETDLCRILGYQIALAVANARLFHSVQQSNVRLSMAYEATLLGWSLALELRDEETQGHTRRVMDITEELAGKMGIVEPELDHVRRGALLHDIGKMGVPDVILRKAGPLTDEEWAIMRRHPEYARSFLVNIDYLAPALDIPYCHHERWDGSGYPRGLAGEDIPLAARIFAVVDVFDALCSDRPYRKAWTKEATLRYIAEQAGVQFDPRVVRVFLEGMAGRV